MNILLTNQRLRTENRNLTELIDSLKVEISGWNDGYDTMEALFESEQQQGIETQNELLDLVTELSFSKKRLESADDAVEKLTKRKDELCKIIMLIEKQKTNLKKLIDVQCMDGNWNYDEYMRGLANGLLVAQSCFDDNECELLDPPERYKHNKSWLTKIFSWFPNFKNDAVVTKE